MNLKKTLGIGAGALLTLALLLGLGLSRWAPAVAQTAPPAADNPTGAENPVAALAGAPVVVVVGKIAELTATGFTLTAPQGTITVLLSSQTWIVVGGASPVEGDAAALQVNMGVHVEGTSPADGQIAARVVRELGAAPAPARPPGPDQERGQEGRPGPDARQLHGTVSAVDASGLTVTLESGRTAHFQVNDATIVYKGGFAAVADLQPGDAVVVVPHLRRPAPPARPAPPDSAAPQGQEGSAPAAPSAAPGISVAGVIWVPRDGEKFVRGRVEKIDGDTRLVSTPGGLLTVQLSDSATVKRVTAPGQAAESATAADVVVDAPVIVFGSDVAGQERTLAATAVVVLPVPPAGPSRPAPLPDNKQP
jgi:hypothetical protein